jgi:hypothetical protein
LRDEGVREYGAVECIETAQTAHNRIQKKKYIMRSFTVYTLHQILLGDQYKGMRFVGHVARVGEKTNDYRYLVWKHKGK